jgi:hypothetical protein
MLLLTKLDAKHARAGIIALRACVHHRKDAELV